MAVSLSAPVGDKDRITKPDPKQKNQKFKPVANKPADVELVQLMLVANGHPVEVDGKCGSGTVKAIRAFQKSALGYAKPDGIVDPDEKTWKAGLPKLVAKIKADEKAVQDMVLIRQKGREIAVARSEFEKNEAEMKRKVLSKAEMMIGQAESWLDFCKEADSTLQGAEGFMQSLTEFGVRWANAKAEPPLTELLDAKSEASLLKAYVSRGQVDWTRVQTQDQKATAAYNKGVKAFKEFIDARIGTAESIVGKLEVVRDISFTAVEAYATVRIMATGKSPAVAHAAAAAGVESMKATANEVGEYLAGKKVSFGSSAMKVMANTLLAGIAGGVGGKLSSGFTAGLHKQMAPRLAAQFTSPAMKRAATTLCTRILDTTFMQGFVTNAAKETIGLVKVRAEKGHWPEGKDFEDMVIKSVLGGMTNIPVVKALMNIDIKAGQLVEPILKQKLAPALAERVKSEMAKKYGKAFLDAWPKIAPEIFEKLNDDLKGKALEIFVMGVADKARGDEKETALVKLGEEALRRDAELNKAITDLIRKEAELHMKEKAAAK